ncbi:MAG TPA: GGDEF domain-containing protein [Streptosporangiaceae bacterium]|nr:GGDEF domain-containing protein [Streptosporangiaceae bacterium]
MPGAGARIRLAAMNPSNPVWTVLGVLLAAAAAALLARRARQGDAASRWLAIATVAWGAAFAAQGASAGEVTPAVIQLTLTDLLALLGLPPFVMGLLRLAPSAAQSRQSRIRRVSDPALLTDVGLLILAAFTLGWIAVLRFAYRATGVGPGLFTVDLIHPVADVLVLAGTLALAVRAGRRALTPFLALVAATIGDFLAVEARASGLHPGSWPQLAWLVAFCLLGAGALRQNAGSRGQQAETAPVAADPPASTLIALGAATVASLVTFIFAIVTWGRSGPVPLLIGALLALALLARIAGLVRQAAAMSALAEEADSQFHQLADRTSDAVLLCDRTGLISYASMGVAHYGYTPEQVAGTRLPDLVHPDDLANVVATVTAVRAGAVHATGHVACRVRSSDGTWRHVEATVSRYAEPGRPDLLLVTARDISDQVALKRQVTHLTFHDGTTGLPNRSYLEERAKDLLADDRDGTEAERVAARRIGAIFVDLDGFTAINDSVGHGAGDLVLAQAGRRLRGLVHALDTVARWGGDEFAVLIESASSPQEIVDVAERLAGAIAAKPFQVAGREVSITASVGVAFADPEVADHLLRNADLAMSRAKDAGGGRVEVFAAHMHADVIRRLELATDLRAAIEDTSLGIEYQPVVELSTSRVASVEALVRWSRNGEAVAPAEFLGVAEDSGLIVPLGSWVLHQACRQVAEWRASGWQIGLSVNFSLRQVSAAGFAESVLTAIDESGLQRSALTIEVTERVLIEVGRPILDGLAGLRQLGVRLAIDDFGTGYASLAYLRQLPVDIIKIDPSFVAGLGTDGTLAMLTRTIVQVGHDLGIEIVAEGIERPEQLELLRAMGCGLGQGYLVARPMTANGIESLAVAGTGLVAGPVPAGGSAPGNGPPPAMGPGSSAAAAPDDQRDATAPETAALG